MSRSDVLKECGPRWSKVSTQKEVVFFAIASGQSTEEILEEIAELEAQLRRLKLTLRKRILRKP